MDIEGVEIEALEGSLSLLSSHKPRFAIASYHLRDGRRTAETLEQMFRSAGYLAETGFPVSSDDLRQRGNPAMIAPNPKLTAIPLPSGMPDADAPPARIPIAKGSTRLNFYWTLAGNILYALCQWAMFSLIAKLDFPAMLGDYALALAISTPLVLLASAPRIIQITAHDAEFTFGDYTLSRLAVLAVGVFVVGLIGALSHYDRLTIAVIGLVMAAKVFDSLSDGV